MHILFISQYFYPEQFSNNAIAKDMVKRGHHVDVVTCVPNYPGGVFFEGFDNKSKRTEKWEGVSVNRVRTVARGKTKLSLICNYLAYPPAALWRIARIGAKTADVSFVSMPSPLFQAFAGVFARWIWGIPTVYWVQDLWPETVRYLFNLKDGPLYRILDRICGWLYRRADIVLVQSAAMVPLVVRHGVDPARIRVLPNSAAELYRPDAAADFPDIASQMPNAPFKIMFAGNVGESQGLEVLVEAADLLREREDIAFVIVGNGRGMAAMQAEITTRGLDARFTFCGRHPEEAMPGFFAQADALFMSLKDFPNFALTVPYKLQTYFACAKPVIASIRGEGAGIVEEAGAGIPCAPEDAEALAAAISTMADAEPEQRAHFGSNARAYFDEHYAAPVVYGILDKALHDAAGKGASADG